MVKKPEIFSRRPYFKEEHVFINPVKSVSGFFERNFSCGMHQQGFYEVNIVTRGQAEHFIGDYQYTVSVGDVFIVPPDVWHGYVGGEGFDVYHLLLTQSYIEKNASDLQVLPAFSAIFKVSPLMLEKYSSKLKFTLSNNELEQLLPVLKSLEVHSKSNELCEHIHIANSEALIIIATLCSIYEKRFLSSNGGGEDESFLKSVAFVYENYNKNVTINELLKIACMSRTAYLTKFKRLTGSTPQALQTKHRVFIAKSLLIQTSRSITKIAEEVGFYDLAHFTRVFKTHTGVSPKDYRKNGVSK